MTTREQDKLDEVDCAYCREKFETWQEAEKHLFEVHARRKCQV